MMLKNGTQIATNVTPNGQSGVGYSSILVIPKIEVTNVRGWLLISYFDV